MSNTLSRRDFLKLGGLSLGSLAFTPSLSRLYDFDARIGLPIRQLSDVELGTDLRLASSSSTPFLKYSFEVASLASVPLVINSPLIFQNRLQQAGYSSLVSGAEWNLASANPTVINCLGVAEHKLFGAPVSLSRLEPDPSPIADYILSQKNGSVVPQTDGLVVRFHHDIPEVDSLMEGDILYSELPSHTEAPQVNQMVVLAKAHGEQSGEQLALIMKLSDNGTSISWHGTDSFDKLGRESPYLRFAAIRTQEADQNYAMKKFWQKSYPSYQSATTTINYKSVPSFQKARFLAGLRCTTDQLSAVGAVRQQYYCEQASLTFPNIDQTIFKLWSSKEFKGNELHGLSDLGVLLTFFKSHETSSVQQPPDPEQLYTFIERQQTENISINDIIESPQRAVVQPELILVTPKTVDELKIADIIFLQNHHLNSPPNVGIVTSVGSEPKSMFFNWQGGGVPRELDQSQVAQLLDKPDNSPVVLRTRYAHCTEYVSRITHSTKIAYADLPIEITSSQPAEMIDFSSIPAFATLQNDVIEATDLASRAHAVQQILANIGVETTDYAEFRTGTRWDSNVFRCSDYSIDAFQAIVRNGHRYLSKWVENNAPSTRNKNAKDIGSASINTWLNKFGEQYGFEDVTKKSREYRIIRLAAGDIMYGAEFIPVGGTWKGIGDTWLIYGMPGPNGEVIPVCTKASSNILGDYPYKPYWFDDPESYFRVFDEDSPIKWYGNNHKKTAGVLFSFKVPLKVDESRML